MKTGTRASAALGQVKPIRSDERVFALKVSKADGTRIERNARTQGVTVVEYLAAIVGRALHGAPDSAEAEIRALAAKNGIGAEPGPLDELARHINRLSDGDDSEPDEVRRLLSNLVRDGVVAGRDATIMLARYLGEARS